MYLVPAKIMALNRVLKEPVSSIKSIARKIAKKSASYLSLENDLKYWAKELNSNIHELQAEGMDYPEDFEW